MGIFNFFSRTKIKEAFHPNGKLKTRTTYQSDNKHGKETIYHDNGVLQAECEWVNGLQNGEIISYDKNGNKVKQSFLINGNYHGTQKEWWPNGQLKTDRIMKNDKIVSEKEYDSKGEIRISTNKHSSSETKKKTTSKKKKPLKMDDIYSDYAKAKKHFDKGLSESGSSKLKENQLAVKYFDKVMGKIIQQDLPLEILSSTAFAPGDGFSLDMTFTLVDLYHLRGCAKFNISDDSSIDDFTEVIKIHENHEDAYYMRGSAYFIILEDWQKAIPDMKKYLTFSPDDKAGNQLLFVLEEIEQNAEKINKLYTKALNDYTEGEKMLSFVDDSKTDVPDEVVDEKKGNKLMKSSLKSLEKASELFSQKNRPNIYLKSHSITLPEIYFKKLQCLVMLQESLESLMNQATEIYKISKGLFKPSKSELGAKIYYTIVEKANSEVKNKISKSAQKKDDKSKLRVNCDEMDDVGIVTYYKNKPFTGIAYWLRDNGNILEDYEMVDGLKNGLNTKYSESGEVVLVLNYIDDEIDPKDEEKRYEHWRKLIQEAMESEIKEESNKNKVKEEQEVMEELSQNDNVKKNINLKNNKMNDTETISMLVTFANTIFSEHPNTFFLIAKCDNSSSDFINESNNSIKGEFEIPAELKNHIEVLKYDIDTSEAFSNGNNYLTMDIDCSVTLSIKTTKDEAIDAIEKYQEDNGDLRWSLSIKWIDADNKEQYSFDSWDEDMLEEIIEDEPCWYEED